MLTINLERPSNLVFLKKGSRATPLFSKNR
nr:MAG TPA: hypothetical protein [Caudoviricetes sp.]